MKFLEHDETGMMSAHTEIIQPQDSLLKVIKHKLLSEDAIEVIYNNPGRGRAGITKFIVLDSADNKTQFGIYASYKIPGDKECEKKINDIDLKWITEESRTAGSVTYLEDWDGKGIKVEKFTNEYTQEAMKEYVKLWKNGGGWNFFPKLEHSPRGHLPLGLRDDTSISNEQLSEIKKEIEKGHVNEKLMQVAINDLNRFWGISKIINGVSVEIPQNYQIIK